MRKNNHVGLLKALFGVLLSVLSLSVFAAETIDPSSGDTWIFYAYGNAEAISSIFNALTMVVNTTSFKTLAIALAIGGFAASGGIGLLSGSPTKFFGYIIGLILLTYALFGLKADVQVKEQIYNPDIPPMFESDFYIAKDVPAAIAVPMVVISQVGSGITDMFKTYFTTPSGDLPPGTLPFGAGMGIAQDMTKVRINNQYLRKNFNEWVGKCLAPRVFSKQINMTEIANTNDIMESLSTTIAAKSKTQFAKMTYLNGTTTAPGAGEGSNAAMNSYNGVLDCSEAFSLLRGQLDISIGSAMGQFSKRLSPMLANGILKADSAGAIASSIAGAAMGNATTMATQGAVIDLINGSSAYQAQVLESNAALLALNLNNAARSQKSGWYTTSVLFRDMGGYFFAILQVFLIGVTPMVLAMMFIPGMGAKLGGSYIKACVWLASWWPALQIVNYIMELYYKTSATAVYSDAGGLTMSNMGLANQFNDNMIIAAGFMATLVPTVMWGIINGAGYALTSVLDRASGASYASSAAQDSAAGNFRAGNVGMNSFSANKFDNSISYATGTHARETFSGLGANSYHNELGGQSANANGSLMTHQYSDASTKKLAAAVSREEAAKESWQNSVSNTVKSSLSGLSSILDGATVGENGTYTLQDQESLNKVKEHVGALQTAYDTSVQHGDKSTFTQFVEAHGGGALKIDTDKLLGGDKPFKERLKDGVKFRIDLGASGGGKGTIEESDSVTMTFNEKSGLTVTDKNGNTMLTSEGLAYAKANGKNTTGTSTETLGHTAESQEMNAKMLAYEQAKRATETASIEHQRSVTTAAALPVTGSNYRNMADAALVLNDVPTEVANKAGDLSLDTPIDDSVQAKVEGAVGAPLQITTPEGKTITGEDVTTAVGDVKAQTAEEIEAAKIKAQQQFNQDKINSIKEPLDKLNDDNRNVVRDFLLKSESALNNGGEQKGEFENGGGQEILSKANNFEAYGQVFSLTGMVANKDSKDGFDLVYRTGTDANDYKYVAVDQDGNMRQLLVEQEEGGQVTYGGYQVNSLSGSAGEIDYAARVGEYAQHRGGNIGEGLIRSGTDIDNFNPGNLHNKNYVSLTAAGVDGMGGSNGTLNAADLGKLSDTGIDRNANPFNSLMSTQAVNDMKLYDASIDADKNSAFAAYQKRHSIDWNEGSGSQAADQNTPPVSGGVFGAFGNDGGGQSANFFANTNITNNITNKSEPKAEKPKENQESSDPMLMMATPEEMQERNTKEGNPNIVNGG